MKKLLLLLLLFTIAHHTLEARQLTPAQLDSLVLHSMKAFNVPGIALAVIKDGAVIHSKGYGVRSLSTMQPVDESTLFGIASNSKAFTAAALGMLVDAGKLKWDDKVREYIPEFKLYDPYVTEAFTIRDLLTHRSGLGLGAGDLMLFPDSNSFTIKDVIYNLRYLKPVSEFRTKYDYDNNLYILAGEVVARVSGMSWESFVESRIMAPIGMSRSSASYVGRKDHNNVIAAHAPVDKKVQPIPNLNFALGDAAGGIFSSVADLSKWVAVLLAHGRYGYDSSKRLWSEKVHEELWSPQTILPVRNPGPYNTHFAAYGLGFFLSDVKGYKQVSHTGGLPGNVTQITMIPELNLGIIVLTNQQEGGAFRAITDQIKDAYFDMPSTDRVSQYAKSRKEAIVAADKITDSIWTAISQVQQSNTGPISFSKYTGTYKDPWFGEVVISAKAGKMYFSSMRSPKLSGAVLPYKGSSFVVKWNDRSMDADAFVHFKTGNDDKATGFTMKAISPLTDFSFDFQDLDFARVK
jgi:CubicO group peptidase (beta-lactamase class C family)